MGAEQASHTKPAVEAIVEEAETLHGGTWIHVKSACLHNADLSERVLWCLGVDWQRTCQNLGQATKISLLFNAAFCWEWWAVAGYRLSYWVNSRRIPYLGRHHILQYLLVMQQGVLLRFCYMVGRLLEALSGARLSGLAEIGPGLLLAHTGSCGIGSGVKIGHTFTLFQDASIVGEGGEISAPVIGDYVTVYSGARVYGPVHIGDGAQIGANALVLRDIPPGCLAIGLPARPIAPGAHAPPYPASFQVRDLVATLVEKGALKETAPGRYIDAATGEEITVQ